MSALTEAVAAVLYEHRQAALACYDHPPTVDRPYWCCACGEHALTTTHRAHLSTAIAAAVKSVVAAERAEDRARLAAETLREAADALSNQPPLLREQYVAVLRRCADDQWRLPADKSRLTAVLDDSCHHCGRMPEADGDHTCLCPLSNSECLTHTVDPVVSLTAVRAAMEAAE